MPEMPEVYTVGRQLAKLLNCPFVSPVPLELQDPEVLTWPPNLLFSSVDVLSQNRILKCEPYEINMLGGMTPVEVVQRGKYLLLGLGDESRTHVIHIYIHFGMTGGLSAMRTTRACLSIGFITESPVHLYTLYFTDVRKFGRVGIVNEELLKRVGPSPFELSDEEVESWTRRYPRSFWRELLLDQSVVSGIGNYIVNEAFWRSQMHPMIRVADVKLEEALLNLSHCRQIIVESCKLKGVSISDYFDLTGTPGSFQSFLDCYRKKECRRCGGTIVRVPWGDSGHYVCESCAPPPEGILRTNPRSEPNPTKITNPSQMSLDLN